MPHWQQQRIKALQEKDFPEVKSINSKIVFLYGEDGFDSSEPMSGFPEPPTCFKKKVISALPVAFIGHSESEYDDLLDSSSWDKISIKKMIFVCEYAQDAEYRKLYGWKFFKKPELLIYGEKISVDNYNFSKNCSGSCSGAEILNENWIEIFLPELNDRAVSKQVLSRKGEIKNLNRLIYWGARNSPQPHRAMDWKKDFSFPKIIEQKSSDLSANMILESTKLKTVNYILGKPVEDPFSCLTTAKIISNAFEAIYRYSPYGKDFNEGMFGVDVYKRISFSGDREKFRQFLTKVIPLLP